MVVLEVGARGRIREAILVEGVKVLRDVEHLGVVATDQVAAGGGRDLAESDKVHVGEFDVLVALEAQRLDCDSPAAHHEGVAALVGGVGGDDEQEAIQGQKFMCFLAAEPALVGRREVGQKQGEDHHVKKLGGQIFDRAAQLTKEGIQGVAGQLQRLLQLQVEKVAFVDAL